MSYGGNVSLVSKPPFFLMYLILLSKLKSNHVSHDAQERSCVVVPEP